MEVEKNGVRRMKFGIAFQKRGGLSRFPDQSNLLGFDKDIMVLQGGAIAKVPEKTKRGTLSQNQEKISQPQADANNGKFLVFNGKKFRLVQDSGTANNVLGSKLDKTTVFRKILPKACLGKINESQSQSSAPSDKIIILKPLAKDDIKKNLNSNTVEKETNNPDRSKPVISEKVDSMCQNQIKLNPKTTLDNLKKSLESALKKPTVKKKVVKKQVKSISNMGRTIKVVNCSIKSSPHMIPLSSKNKPFILIKDISDISTIKSTEIDTEKKEVCNSSDKNDTDAPNLITSSTNTDILETVDKEIQTMDPWESFLDNLEDEIIIGSNVNMGSGPRSLHSHNDEQAKIQFYHDLQNCLKWDSGNLPIHAAVIQRDIALVKNQCVVLKARRVGVNIPNCNDYTPLQLAVIHGVGPDIVQLLLQYNADMSVLDSEGNNILHLAVQYNRIDLMRIFMCKKKDGSINVDQFNYDGLTPLMCCALHKDRIDIAQRLLENRVRINLRDLKSGRTAIFHAAENHNTPMVSLLLDYSADTKIRNFFGTSVHDAMFEIEDMPREIKFPILNRDLRVHQKRKKKPNDVKHPQDESPKRTKLEIVSTYKRIGAKESFTNQLKN